MTKKNTKRKMTEDTTNNNPEGPEGSQAPENQEVSESSVEDQREKAQSALRDQIQRLEGQVKLHPNTRAYWVQLGNTCKRAGEIERAKEALKKALELKPDDVFTKNALAELKGKGLKLPTYRPKTSSKRDSSDLDPAQLMKKYTLPVAAVIALLIGAFVYKFWSGVKSPDPHIIMETHKNLRKPKISPNDSLIAFSTSPTDADMDAKRLEDTIFVATPDSKTITPIITETKEFTAGSNIMWLPDSSGFVVRTKRKGEESTFSIITVADKNVESLELEYPPASGVNAALSPDGKRIAYVHYGKDEDTGESTKKIMIAEMDSGSAIEVATYRNIKDLAWSPDGKILAYSISYYDVDLSETIHKLMAINVDGTGEVTIDEINYSASPIFFGAEDTKLVYRNEGMLYFVPADTLSGPQSLISSRYAGRVERGLSVSGDLTVLAFGMSVEVSGGMVMGQATATDIFLLKEGETEPFHVENGHRMKEDPSLSQDGSWMAYEFMALAPIPNPFQVWVGSTALQ